MKKFVFITTRNQHQYDHPLRSRLWDVCLKALNNQTSNNWQAIVVGLDEKVEGNVIYLKAKGEYKRPKIEEALAYIAAQEKQPEYLIRMDDDDLISATILSRIESMDFDAYTDKHHAMYDITDGKSLANDHTWFPNTSILRYSDAIQPFGEEKMPLFMYDHDQSWHKYFANKKVWFAPKNDPVYLRIISPSSVSISGTWDNVESYDREDYQKYREGLAKWRRFNRWKKRTFKGLTQYLPDLEKIREELFAVKS